MSNYKYTDENIIAATMECFTERACWNSINRCSSKKWCLNIYKPGSKKYREWVANGLHNKASIAVHVSAVASKLGMPQNQCSVRLKRLAEKGVIWNKTNDKWFALPTREAMRVVNRESRKWLKLGIPFKVYELGKQEFIEPTEEIKQIYDKARGAV